MNSRWDITQWSRRHGTSFWMAATLGVPTLLSAAVLVALLTKLLLEGSGIPALGSRFAVIGVVELILVVTSLLLARRRTDWTTGVALASAIVAILLVPAAVVMT